MDRRFFLAGTGAALATPAIAAPTARRVFQILRDGDDIGRHTMIAVQGINGFTLDTEIDIKVTFLGVTAYRYLLKNREIWKAGQLVSMNATTNDDGTEDAARVRAGSKALRIEGSRLTGEAPLNAVTTSYFATPFLKRRPWISTQSGKPLKIDVTAEGRRNWWSVSGELNTRLGYDQRGEWVGCEFDAGGEPGRYEMIGEAGRIGELWSQA